MKETINALNHTSGERTFFYCVVFLIALAIVTEGIASIIRALKGK